MRIPILTVLLICVAGSAHADGTINNIITASDKARLESYETIKKQALDEAKTDGNAANVAELDKIFTAAALSFNEDFDMTGDWQCRTTKLGKTTPLVIYSWFKCRVTDDGSGWMLEKISGSQRTKGRFFTESDTRLTYLGSGYIAGDQPKKYGAGADTDEVGYTYKTSKDSFRIEFPAPARESLLDVLELKR
ncbi:DUF4893 domain-containing protein [Phyllobacterium sp. SB3]|uniref:DUF4893 domain-containing protein n=1 Tax=Phyllobacterium sp. SB3 TaxID=3156073 RepID=UPI0032B00A4B